MPYRNAICLFVYATGIDEFLHTKIYERVNIVRNCKNLSRMACYCLRHYNYIGINIRCK